MAALPDFSTLPPVAIVGLAAAVILQVTLDVIALVDLYRRPADRVQSGNKWIWLAVILLANFIGAVLYLIVGRMPAAVDETRRPSAPSPTRTTDIADALYGRTDGDRSVEISPADSTGRSSDADAR